MPVKKVRLSDEEIISILDVISPELIFIRSFRRPDKSRLMIEVDYAGFTFETRFELLRSGSKPYFKRRYPPCIYKMFNENEELIYIGKTKNINERINSHKEKSDFSDEVYKIEVSWFQNECDMHIYEPYLISIHNPKYNKQFTSDQITTLTLPLLEWNDFTDYWRGMNASKKN